MLVNVSYSIDFDKVPKVVRRFLQDDIQRELGVDVLSRIEDSIACLEDGRENVGETIRHIDEIRQLLVKVDVRLQDCSNILRGYQKEIIEPTRHNAPSPQGTDLSTLQQELAELKSSLVEEYNETEDR
jgi:hypothetical protein